MSLSIYISRRANTDLAAIWDYTAEEYGPAAADNYIIQLYNSMVSLADFPMLGSDYSHIRKGYRKLSSASHLIFYIAHDDGIEIIRILHAKVDIEGEIGSG